MGLFGQRMARPGAAVRAQVVAWVREAGELAEDVVVKVSEIVCPDPACPGTETVILVMVPGRPTLARKIAKPLDAVTWADAAAAMAES